MVARLISDVVTFEPPQRESWMDDGRCLQTDPNLFFPKNKENLGKAKKLCEQCDVRIKCLAWIMSQEKGNRRYGIAGGKTAAEREKLQKLIDQMMEGQVA